MKFPFFLFDLAALKDNSTFPGATSRDLQEGTCASEILAWTACANSRPDGCSEDFSICQSRAQQEWWWVEVCPGAVFDPAVSVPPGPAECACYKYIFCDFYPSCCNACASEIRDLMDCLNIYSLGGLLAAYCPDMFCSGGSGGGGSGGGGSGGGGSGGGGGSSGEATPTPDEDNTCFSATASVEVLGTGQVEMQKLKVGDKVLTATETDKAEYQPVYAFGHRSPTALGRFLQITTDTDTLEITSEHLLYVAGKSHPVRADSIIVGDKLQTADGSASKVQKIKTVMKEGLYAPLTPSGKLVVNRIQTSAYIALQKDDQEMFTTLNGLITIPHSSYIHLYLAPLRVVCLGVSSMPCQLMHENGMPLYIKWGIDAINMAHRDSNVYAELLFVVISGIFLSGFVAVEALFGASMGPLIVFSVCVAYSVVRKTHAVKTNNAKKAA